MAIERVQTGKTWTETANDPKSARELIEKHGPALQKRGAEDFHNKYMKDISVGFERVADPSGKPTYVRKDRMEKALSEGYGKAPTAPRMTVPALPWQKDRRFGERYEEYKRRVSGSKAED